ncbi:MAG: hypothetical protein B6U76_00120 [Desulfurococcales archaeon ex4484_217_2]|nr:MAG: hypothetical protein B6U76_00120 [Desulfurococcales archaeon ex4484_217_2]
MISKKLFKADGTTKRFLPDFYIKASEFCRPYVYFYDSTLPVDGSGDHLVDDTKPWSYPDNLYIRGSKLPEPLDLVSVDHWEVIDNGVLFYSPPPNDVYIHVEVATTYEEFGDTLVPSAVEEANEAAERAQEEAWNAEAEKMTADSYATEPEDIPVKIWYSNGDGTFSWIDSTDYSSYHWSKKSEEGGGGGGESKYFTDLLDTPPDYSGHQGKLVKVNATEDGLIFGDPSGTTVSWGDIQGTLSNQTDLQQALDTKADNIHTHQISDVDNLQTELDSKAESGDIPSTTDYLTEGLTNLYYTESRVSDNLDVSSNTSARHTHSNQTILDGIIDLGSGEIITSVERTKVARSVDSDTSVVSGSDQVRNMISLTQAEYDGIATPDAQTLYIIVG